MLADVFLYGRTGNHDYFDMYIPSWMKADTDEYREYRKTVSFIMKIRDVLPEDRLSILNRTADSFVFIRGRKISLLGRFCNICGVDEFDRPVCSTEGFVVRNENIRDFWKMIPEMITLLSDTEKNYYREYSEKYSSENKPESLSRSEDIIFGNTGSIKLGQFEEMKDAVSRTSVPFSFAYGPEEKALYDYSSADDSVRVSVFFASDECTEIEYEESVTYKTDTGGLVPYAEIRKSTQGRLKYKVVFCSENISGGKTDIPLYESYEREAGSEIKISELFRMYETVGRFIAQHGVDDRSRRKCVPYDSESDAEYSGNELRLEYCPPAEQKRSLLQMLKGVKQPDFTEYIILKTADKEQKLNDTAEIQSVSDDSSARLLSYEKLMEAAN